MAILPNFNLEKEYEIVFNNTQDALFIMEIDENKDFRFLKLNPTHENLTGLKTEDIAGKTPVEVLGAEMGEVVKARYQKCLDQKKTITYEEVLDLPGGKKVWSTKLSPVFEAGEITHIVGSARNISERKKLEEEKKELSRRYKLATSAAEIGVWKLDLDTNEIIWDEYMFKIYETEEDKSYSYEDWTEHIYYKDKEKTTRTFRETIKNNEIFSHEFRIKTDTGKVKYIKAFGKPILEKDQPVEVIGVNYDITEKEKALKKLEDYSKELKLKNIELKQASYKAREASRAKSEFLSTMSHEIRTPMNSIIGMAELLQDTNLNEQQKKYVNIFQNAGESLLTLINDILDLSKIEAGKVELEKKEFNLVRTVENIAEMISVRAYEKGLEMPLRISSKIPECVIGDSDRFRQVLINLLGNAVKFTESGQVFLDLRIDPDFSEANKTKVIFAVKDTGIGIAEEKQETIFNSFTQADASSTRKYGGTGLGLTISKQLVELMGGEIWLKSSPGLGSTFYFSLPFEVLNEEIEYLEIKSQQFNDLRILTVDDNSTNNFILQEIMAEKGAEVDTASSGEEALEVLAESIEADNPYQIILMDNFMPKKSGLEIAAEIKKKFKIDNLQIIILSSDFENKYLETYKAFIDDYMMKPIRKKELFSLLEKAAVRIVKKEKNKKISSIEPEKRNLNLAEQENKKILVVEDNPDNQFLIKAFLKKKDYLLEMAENGIEGLEKFKNNDYDLILMDIQMPEMNGYQAINKIRAWEAERNIAKTKVIALTAYALDSDKDRALQEGFDDHLTKPIKKDKLFKMIDDYLKY